MKATKRLRSLTVLTLALATFCAALWACSSDTEVAKDGQDAGPSAKPQATEHGDDGRFAWNADEVVDKAHGLGWQRVENPSPMAWDDAARSCTALNHGALQYRVPTREELAGIFADDVPFAFFPLESEDWYWSASAGESRGQTRWAGGKWSYANSNGVDTVSRVRCVRTIEAAH